MKRLFLVLCVSFVIFAPYIVQADLVPCGDADQDTCQTCHVVVLVNNVINWLVKILGTIAAIMFIYAGFKLVTSQGNVSALSEAKRMANNLIIGYVIVLGGWLLVDTGLKALLSTGESGFGMWNEIECVIQPNAVFSEPDIALAGVTGWDAGAVDGTMVANCDIVSPGGSFAAPIYDCSAQLSECADIVGSATVSADGSKITCAPSVGGTVSASGLGQCSASNVACSVTSLQAAGLSAEEANIMSCIAMTESSGIPSSQSNSSSACGTFQITEGTWGDFNSGVSSGCSSFSSCKTASCNIEVMVNLVNSVGYSRWLCEDCNAKAASCVSQYGG